MKTKGTQQFTIIGESVQFCTLAENERMDSKFYRLDLYGKLIFKQKKFCFDTEIQALDELQNKLEKSLEITKKRIDTIINNRL